MSVLIVICASCAAAMACANHSLQSYFFQKEFFNVILSDLNKLSLSFKPKKKNSYVSF